MRACAARGDLGNDEPHTRISRASAHTGHLYGQPDLPRVLARVFDRGARLATLGSAASAAAACAALIAAAQTERERNNDAEQHQTANKDAENQPRDANRAIAGRHHVQLPRLVLDSRLAVDCGHLTAGVGLNSCIRAGFP